MAFSLSRAFGDLFSNSGADSEAIAAQNELCEAIVEDVAASLKSVMRYIGEQSSDDGDLLDESKQSVRFLCSTLERLLFNGVNDAHFWPLVESLGASCAPMRACAASCSFAVWPHAPAAAQSTTMHAPALTFLHGASPPPGCYRCMNAQSQSIRWRSAPRSSW